MFKNIIKTLALVLFMLMLVTACTPVKGQIYSRDSSISWPKAPDEIDSEFRSSLIDFAWDLFKISSKNEGNILISPASVYLALGMTCNGADGETRQAMAAALKAADISIEEFNRACRDYISILRVMGDKTELSVANSIWYKNGFPVSDDFLQINADYFDAHVQSLDFNNPKAPETINNWVKEKTNNTIDNIINEIEKNVIMYLVNAVYFNSKWKVPFDPQLTRRRNFNSPGGIQNPHFMYRHGKMDYFNVNGIRGVILPYDDGRFKFFAMLPENNTEIRSFIQELDGDKIYDCLTSSENQEVDLYLPKFKTEFEDELKDELSSMGMEIAFDPYKADFSLMTNKSMESGISISRVIHKTFCRVDEEGTEASALTAMEMPVSAPIEVIELVFDRPFVYGIIDEVTGAPLFLGIMENL